MKKRLFSLILVFIILVYSVPTFALDKSNLTSIDVLVTNSPTYTVSSNNFGTYDLTISSFEKLSETEYEYSTSMFMDVDTNYININSFGTSITNGGGNLYDDSWFLGSSCYIKLSIVIKTITGNSGVACKITFISTYYKTNSGTRVSSATLNYGGTGITTSNTNYSSSNSVNVSSSSYTTTATNSYPYLYTGMYGVLGSTFIVTATRPSGSSQTASVQVNIFNN